MATPSNRFINTTTCKFTPTGGSLTAILGVQSVSRDPQTVEERGSGDGDYFDTFAGIVAENTMVTVELLNVAALNAITSGAVGALVWTQNDARNGALTASGALIYTLSNAVYHGTTVNAPHRKLASGTMRFSCYSSDGTTNPLAFAAA